jgi:hypothetical protein
MNWRFPPMRATNLEGVGVLLPDGLEGDPSVVIVAFERHQQSEVDSWMPWLGGLREQLPRLEIYELPAIARGWRPARRFIDGGMRAGIPDPEIRRRTLTAYTDIRVLTDALRIQSTSTIAVFVVSVGGSVLWSGRGAYAPNPAADLQRAATAAHHDREAAWHGS